MTTAPRNAPCGSPRRPHLVTDERKPERCSRCGAVVERAAFRNVERVRPAAADGRRVSVRG